MSNGMGLVIPPEMGDLKEEIKRLRVELSMFVSERDELKYVICRNIETAYLLELGALEYKVYEAYCRYRRLKRKAELIQRRKNRQERIDASAIEEELDAEFEEFREKLSESMERMNAALERSRSKLLSPEETKELKKLYRMAVKRLHPDLNPALTEAEERLFRQAVTAYENGDLAAMRIVCDMAGDGEGQCAPDTAEELRRERDRLAELTQSIRREMDTIRSEYPYTMKEILDNEEMTEQKRKNLESILAAYRDGVEAYENVIAEMLR